MLKAMLGEAWLAMGANRLRTALTMLGMVIGVGAVVIMMAIGQGAQYAVQQTISTMGSNLFIVLSGSSSSKGTRSSLLRKIGERCSRPWMCARMLLNRTAPPGAVLGS